MTTNQKTKKSGIVSLKALCLEFKTRPREARENLRIAVRDPKKYLELKKAHAPRQPWQWEKGSAALKEARAVLSA